MIGTYSMWKFWIALIWESQAAVVVHREPKVWWTANPLGGFVGIQVRLVLRDPHWLLVPVNFILAFSKIKEIPSTHGCYRKEFERKRKRRTEEQVKFSFSVLLLESTDWFFNSATDFYMKFLSLLNQSIKFSDKKETKIDRH